MVTAEQQVLPSRGGAPGRPSTLAANRLGRPELPPPATLSRFPSVAPALGVSRGIEIAILGALSLTYPPHAVLIGTSASLLPETFSGELSAIEADRRASDLLQESRPLVDAIRDLLTREARARSIRVKNLSVSHFSDPEETTGGEIVVTQHVDLPAEKALAYWDEVGAAVARWRSGLPPADAERALRSIAIDIKWSDAESTSV
jgi:hypothetical protein